MNADFIAAHERVHGMRLATCMCGWEEPIRGRAVTAVHAAHVAAAIREARTVRTESQWDTLPEGTLLLTLGGDVARIGGEGCEAGRRAVHHEGWTDCCGTTLGLLPALILWRPDEDGAQP